MALSDADRTRAAQILETWSGSGLVFIGSLTMPGDGWPPANNPNDAKIALLGGNVVAAAPMPTMAPPPGEVRWASGGSLSVPLISATQALDEMHAEAEAPCGSCAPIEVDSATLTTATFDTSRGQAVAPAWSFHIKGSDTWVLRIAVGADQRTISSPPENLPYDRYLVGVDSAIGDAASTELTLVFTGAPGAADKPCGEDYGATAAETGGAIVAFVFITRSYAPPGGACPAVGARREATLDLSSPLGDRVVLDARGGGPVPVTPR